MGAPILEPDRIPFLADASASEYALEVNNQTLYCGAVSFAETPARGKSKSHCSTAYFGGMIGSNGGLGGSATPMGSGGQRTVVPPGPGFWEWITAG